MNVTIVVLSLLLLLGIVILIVHFLTTKTLATALGSLLSILSALVTALVAPGAEGQATLDLRLGPFGSITGKWLQLNTTKPIESWYVAFLTTGLLILVTLYFVYDTSVRNQKRPYGA
jgi:hypothetical protein